MVTRTQFNAGGASRTQFTYPPLVFAALSLARRVYEREQKVAALSEEEAGSVAPPQYSAKKVFHIVMDALSTLSGAGHAETAMKLFLQAAQQADACRFSAIAYEFVKEALLLYECEITDSRQQVRIPLVSCGLF